MAIKSGVCWSLNNSYIHRIGHATPEGPMLRYARPNNINALCPNVSTYGRYATYPTLESMDTYDEEVCQHTGCFEKWGGDPPREYLYLLASEGPQLFEGIPDRWIVDTHYASESFITIISTSPGSAYYLDMISRGYETPGPTDLPYLDPEDPPNGWAGYPESIKIHYTSFTASERAARNFDPGVYNFQIQVLNMRGDVIGASGGHADSGEEIPLTYPSTDHGGGVNVTWDIGAIAIIGQYIKTIDSIWFKTPGNANGDSTEVYSIVVSGISGTEYSINVTSASGGGRTSILQGADNIGIVVHIEITPTEAP